MSDELYNRAKAYARERARAVMQGPVLTHSVEAYKSVIENMLFMTYIEAYSCGANDWMSRTIETFAREGIVLPAEGK
jgi:hypothetical protein